ncbi:MAG: hypothetical protein KKF48_03715 [Nanoarchaeota archaeon]|nr:hypothetical protein [Nanoarchaeota archaeon]MBU1028125.1 hypothetical protein [Nanoarchaeota archaeon]
MKNKHAAMEMSVGTIVTIVLLMSVLILGIFLVQKVFKSSSNAIDNIDNQVQNEINKLFAEEGKKLAIYPTSRDLILKKGDDPKGFAFSVKNNDVESADFTYTIEADDVSKCGSSFSEDIANNYLLGGSGSFSLGPGNSMDLPRLVKFNVPESAPPCTIIYNLDIQKTGASYTGAQVFATIK